MTRSWIFLFVAGLLEIVWAVLLPRTEGFTKLVPTIVTLVPMGISFFFLSMAVRDLPVGTAYAVWTGIGAAGTVLFGIFFAGEPAHWFRLLCIALILFGTIGLKFSVSHP